VGLKDKEIAALLGNLHVVKGRELTFEMALNALGWAESIKMQASILRRAMNISPRRPMKKNVLLDVQRGKVGVVEIDVDYKGSYFRSMAQQEGRELQRMSQKRQRRINRARRHDEKAVGEITEVLKERQEGQR
jgi:hypothetical protein